MLTDTQSTIDLESPAGQDRKTQAAQILKLSPDHITTVRMQLDILRQQGILVDLNVGGTSMFSRAATWMELGILEEDVRRARFTKGQKFLIPEDQVKYLRSLESRMRQLLEKYSYGVTGFYPWRWIPFTAYAEWRDEWSILVDEWSAAKQSIIDRHADYQDALVEDFNQVAANAWQSITAQGYRGAVIDGASYDDIDAFTDAIIARVLAKFPTIEDIQTRLVADYVTALVYSEQDLAADRLAAEITRAKERETYLQAHLLESQVQHQADLQRIERARLVEQTDHEVNLHRLVEEEKAYKIRAMLEAEAAHARQSLQQMVSPFEEVFTSLRQQMAMDVQSMLESIQKNGYVRGKIAEKGRGLVEFYELMSIHDDHELRDRLIALKQAIGPIGEERNDTAPERDPDQIVSILNQIASLSHTAAQDLAAGPSRFSLVEV